MPEFFSLTDRVALVTGGGLSIGSGIARRLAEAGARVAIFDAQRGPAEEVAAAMSRLGPAGLGSLAGTRVSLENVKGRLLLHFGDVDHDTTDP